MDINLGLSVSDTFKQALNRIDGLAMYLAVAILLLGALLFGCTDFWMGFSHTERWKLVWSSTLLAPIIFIYYVSLATCSSSGQFSRILNAIFLVGIPVLFYWMLL